MNHHQHRDKVTHLAWSPNWKWIASSDVKNEIHVWDPHTGVLHSIYNGHSTPITALAWSPQGSLLASIGWDDDTIHLWDPVTNAEYGQLYGNVGETIAWSFDNRFVAVAGYHYVYIFDVQSLNLTRSIQVKAIADAICWSPSMDYFAIGGGNGTIYIYDAATYSMLYRVRAHIGILSNLTFSPNSRWLASSSFDSSVQVREVTTGSLVMCYRKHYSGSRYDTRISPNSAKTKSIHTSYVKTVRWDTNSSFLVSIGETSVSKVHPDYAALRNKELHIWEAITGSTYFVESSIYGISDALWSPDGRLFAQTQGDTVVIRPNPIEAE